MKLTGVYLFEISEVSNVIEQNNILWS